MKLLVKRTGGGLAAHMVDGQGKKVCNVVIKPAGWAIQDCRPEDVVICHHCQRIQARRANR